ncbi:hypothetical protein [Alistipes sp.]|uniref:hypothetical protein n=1 Tax=Alistipes sp. TaxID=1872444 RepID=UPI003AF04D67
MPQNKFALARYFIIDMLLHKKRYAKTSEVVEICRERIGYRVTRRTIQLDIEAMRHDPLLGFHAPINYCPYKKAYYYADSAYTLHPFSFTLEEATLLESVMEQCRPSITPGHFSVLCRLAEKIRFYAC